MQAAEKLHETPLCTSGAAPSPNRVSSDFEPKATPANSVTSLQ